MSANSTKSTRSTNSARVRTISQPFPQDHLCRYLISGNRRCQRISGRTGSGLCILHDRQLMSLRDAESRSLGNQAMGKVKDLNTSVAIHSVFARVVKMGLYRRYSSREVAVFTSAFRTLSNTLGSAHSDIHNARGYRAINPLIHEAIAAEPSLRKAVAPVVAPRENVSSRARASARGTCSSPLTSDEAHTQQATAAPSPREAASSAASVGAGLDRDNGQVPPADQASTLVTTSPPSAPSETLSSRARASARGTCSSPLTSAEVSTQPANDAPTYKSLQQSCARLHRRILELHAAELNSAPPASRNRNDDGSVPYTHMQTYVGVTVPLHGRLRKG